MGLREQIFYVRPLEPLDPAQWKIDHGTAKVVLQATVFDLT